MPSGDVLEAANELIAAFAANRVEDYFACFSPDASFLFHATPGRLDSRARYEALWRRWVTEDDFRVVSCLSSNQTVQLLGDGAAVFAHDVETVVHTSAGESTEHERETIVFARKDGGSWLAVHEHLSPDPAFAS